MNCMASGNPAPTGLSSDKRYTSCRRAPHKCPAEHVRALRPLSTRSWDSFHSAMRYVTESRTICMDSCQVSEVPAVYGDNLCLLFFVASPPAHEASHSASRQRILARDPTATRQTKTERATHRRPAMAIAECVARLHPKTWTTQHLLLPPPMATCKLRHLLTHRDQTTT